MSQKCIDTSYHRVETNYIRALVMVDEINEQFIQVAINNGPNFNKLGELIMTFIRLLVQRIALIMKYIDDIFVVKT